MSVNAVRSRNEFLEECKEFCNNFANNHKVKVGQKTADGHIVVYIRGKRRNIVGLVVVFRKDNQILVGWSLFNTKAEKKQNFNKYYGLRNAVLRAVPMEQYTNEYMNQEVANTARPYIVSMFDRAKKYFKI